MGPSYEIPELLAGRVLGFFLASAGSSQIMSNQSGPSTGSPNSSTVRALSIEDKIRRAGELFSEHGTALSSDPALFAKLASLRERITCSWGAMRQMGVVALCRECDEEQGGSCCGAGIENRFTPGLLLLNLLMGIEIPLTRVSENSCRFLGERGCGLIVRHVICVNYVCGKIQKALSTPDLISLQETTGEEMEAVFYLHEYIKKALSRL